ncbi:hypothetical protein [Geodermatophilus chilensis]|uniref:hypothetical protein n=1 Tax=Geodermatophilus chilensis TaxID=2035835 RepID=UPI000C26127E|nr:hypothetical protein [Geodermatophilus chilensis]
MSTKNKLSLLKGKKPRETTHAVVLDHEAVEAYAEARRVLQAAQLELRNARRRAEPEITMGELQAVVDEAQAAADELQPAADDGVGVVSVKIRAMPPVAYRALKAEFPPTDADHARVRADVQNDKAKAAWNRDEFAPRLIAACVIDPETSLEDAQGYRDAWSEPEFNMLVNACVRVHEDAVDTSALVFSSGRTRS